MLFRYTAEGEFGGDTWHPSLDAAREQVEYEYEEALGEWVHVPAGVDSGPMMLKMVRVPSSTRASA